MGDLTKNISRRELACSCGCGFASVDWQTVEVVQKCCDHFAEKLGVEKVTLRIHSAARCFKWNRVPVADGGPGSNDYSQHPLAMAIDFSIDEVPPSTVHYHLTRKYPRQFGIGRYRTFTHLDCKPGVSRRWG